MSYQKQPNQFSDKQMSIGEAAYVAGIVDGEGTIGLRRNRPRSRGTDKFCANLRVANTNLDMLQALVARSGNGQIVQKNLAARAHRPCYEWVLSANQIRHILPQLQPYLSAKTRQAELLLRYLGLLHGNRGILEQDRAEVVAIHEELSQLNSRGITSEEEADLIAAHGRKECSEEGCDLRCYRNHPWCYDHWYGRRERQVRDCEQCGNEMEAVDDRKRFCSGKCQLAYWHLHKQKVRRQAAASTRLPGICPACGSEVDRTHYAGKVYCNEKCQWSHRAAKQKRPEGFVIDKTCVRCGVAFQTKINNKKYCSDTCNKQAFKERQKE